MRFDDVGALCERVELESVEYKSFQPGARSRRASVAPTGGAPSPEAARPANPPVNEQPRASAPSPASAPRRQGGEGLWPVVDQMLGRPHHAPSAELPRASCGLFSAGSGAGATTVLANLAQLFARRGESTLAADESPETLLPFHFGAGRVRRGLLSVHSRTAAEAPLYLLAPEQRQNGAAAGAAVEALRHVLLESDLRLERLLLRGRLQASELQNSLAAGAVGSLVLVPAEPAAIFRLPAVIERLGALAGRGGAAEPHLLLTRFDPDQPLHNEIRGWLAARFGERLLPFVLRQDPAAPRALMQGAPLVDFAPESALAQDLGQLADWLSTRPGWAR